MPTDLKKLTRELRRERCPDEVLARVMATVEAEAPPRYAPWWLMPAAAGLILAFIIGFGLLRPTPKQNPVPRIVEHLVKPPVIPQPSSAEVASQAEASMVLVGYYLRESGLQSGQEIVQTTLPRLQAHWGVLKSSLSPIPLEPTPTPEHEHES